MSSTKNLQHNFLANNRALLSIPDFNEQDYQVTTFNVPGISAGAVVEGTPFSWMNIPADHLSHEPITVTFNVTENLENWLEIKRWMFGHTFPENFAQYQNRPYTTKDISIIIYSNNNQPVGEFVFHGAFPTSLSGLEFTTQATDYTIMTASATFVYSYFEAKFDH